MSKTVNFEKKELKTVVKFKKQTSGETNYSSKSSYHTFQCKGVINNLPDDVICDIAIYADDATHNSKCDQASDLWQQLELASGLESHLRDTVGWAQSGLLISLLGNLNWLCLTGLITLVLSMRKWMGLFLWKNHLLRCWG